MKQINKQVGINMYNNILTFVKIRNDQHGDSVYNNRFNILLNSKRREESDVSKMLVYYNDDNNSYYKINKETGVYVTLENPSIYEMHADTKEVDVKKIVEYKDDGNSQDSLDTDNVNKIPQPKPYDHKYIFGEFTNIFHPEYSNGNIATQMTQVKNLLKKKKTVFMMGYGASGAGKTSTLIYFNKGKNAEQRNGILIQLCNQLAQEGLFDTLDIEYREFYKTREDRDYRETPVNTEEKSKIIFKYVNGNFFLQDELEHKNHHEFRAYKVLRNEIQEKEKDQEKKSSTTCNSLFEDAKNTTFYGLDNQNPTELGQFLIHLIDNDRHVKATTNNPNSSRSHALIFVKMSLSTSSEAKPAYLMVGDFAGVENVFDCDNPSVLQQFMEIQGDDGKGAFYKNEICDDIEDQKKAPDENNKMDPIGPLQTVAESKNSSSGIQFVNKEGKLMPRVDKTNLGGAIIKNNLDDMYDFREPSIYASNTESVPHVYMENQSKGLYLKSAIRLIRSIAGIPTFKKDGTWMEYEKLPKLQNKKNKSNDFQNFETDLEKYTQNWNDHCKKLFCLNDEDKMVDRLLAAKKEAEGQIDKLKEITDYNLFATAILRLNEGELDDLEKIEISKRTRQNFIIYDKKRDMDDHQAGAALLAAKAYYNIIKKSGMDTDNKAFIDFKSFGKKHNDLGVSLNATKAWYGNSVKEAFAFFNQIEKNDSRIKTHPFMKVFMSYFNGRAKSEKLTYSSYYPEIAEALKAHATKVLEGLNTPKRKELIEYINSLISSSSVTLKKLLTPGNELFPYDDIKESFRDGSLEEDADPIAVASALAEKNDKDFKLQALIDVFNSDNELVTFLLGREKHRVDQMEISTIICEQRREEGYFINSSLSDIRGVIRELLIEKNKENLDIVPNYIDICFDKYCPSHEGCFSFGNASTECSSDTEFIDSDSSNYKLMKKSVIFNSIYQYFVKQNQGYQLCDMYKDLTICVFCVLNISKRANNPPPTPYVDINELKRLVMNYDLFSQPELGKEFVFHAENLIASLNHKYINVSSEGKQKNILESLIVQDRNKKKYDGFLFKLYLEDGKEKIASKEVSEPLKTNFGTFKFITDVLGGSARSVEKKKFYNEIYKKFDLLAGWIGIELRRLNMEQEWINGKRPKKKYVEILNEDDLNTSAVNHLIPQGVSEDKINLAIQQHILTNFKKLKLYFENRNNEELLSKISGYLKPGGDIEQLPTYAQDDTSNERIKEHIELIEEMMNEAKEFGKELNERLDVQLNKTFEELVEINDKNKRIVEKDPKIKSKIKEFLIEFLESIDNSNAVSAIGTLEFTDKMSKLNTVSSVCNYQTNQQDPNTKNDNNTLINNFISGYDMVPLYNTNDNPTSGGERQKKHTKKNTQKNNKTKRILKK